jgi:hypothetical protein
MNRSGRCRLVGGALALTLSVVPARGQAQVLLATRPHPEFAIGPLLVVAGVRPDLGPVSVRVSFGLTLPPNGHLEDMQQDLYLLWPAEIAEASASGAPDAALRAYVEQRGFAVVSEAGSRSPCATARSSARRRRAIPCPSRRRS